MANKKYEFTGKTRTVEINEITYVVKRIKALEPLDPPGMDGDVSVGDLGGWIESEDNLSEDGMCWVNDEAVVIGKAIVKDNAYVCGRSTVKDEAIICDDSIVDDDATIAGNSVISENSVVYEDAQVLGNVIIKGDVRVRGCAVVYSEFGISAILCEPSEKSNKELGSILDNILEQSKSVIGGNIVIDSSWC